MSWDVLVAGAGPAGAVAARVLAGRGRRVLLTDTVDAVEGGARKVGESLPGAARPLLRDLGLLDRVERGPHLPSYGNLSAWGSDALHSTDAIRDPHGPGWHLDRPRFDRSLREAAQEAGATLHPGLVLRAERTGEEGWRVELKGAGAGAEPVKARWLVDATGRHATIARGLGARRERDTRTVALVAWSEPSESADRPEQVAPPGPAGGRDTRTLVEAVPEGWWYTALLPNGGRVVVLHVDPDEAASILHAPGAWDARLARTVHVRRVARDGAPTLSAPTATGASGARLDHFAGDRWLAVGDAALSFDPLSSQGLFNALYTGMRGAQTVDTALGGTPDDDQDHLDPIATYSDRLETIRQAYLHHHRAAYAAETRWPDQPFWARRRG